MQNLISKKSFIYSLSLTCLSASALVMTAWFPGNAAQIRPPIKTAFSAQVTVGDQLQDLSQKYHLISTASIPNQQRVTKAIVIQMARRYQVPIPLALGLSGHESGGWKMWQSQRPLKNININSDNSLHSTDWGVMQINDQAHPAAFPQAKTDLEFNIEYGMKYLSQLHTVYAGDLNQGFGNWDQTLAAYHLGHAPITAKEVQLSRRYLQQIQRFLKQENLLQAIHYTVQAGDTLSTIAAEQLGDSQRWIQICQDNHLTRSGQIKVGQRLVLHWT